ncbi:redox-regulated ATPase YchF [Patescibacteria group bacterium]|nr:redox-regulated ATPase YchF [Patescibacteria group bacterium]
MKLSIGIVGLPNVGKSTLFTALTKKKVDVSNYPFATIDPNIGIVEVPDDRLSQLNSVYKAPKVVPTVIEFVDIAGLVRGAHKGEGLGNKFLSHIREVDVICQVVRGFSDADVTHVSGKVDPQSDIETINTELIFADLATVSSRMKDIESKAKSGDKESLKSLSVFKKIQKLLDQGEMLSQAGLSRDELLVIYDVHLLTIKPMMYILNVDEQEAGQPVADRLVISAKVESELSELSSTEAVEYLRTLNLESSGLDRLIAAAYDQLGLITFFTAGPTEVHAWAIERDSTAPQAGGKIHSDFEERFIRAEVIRWQEVVEFGGESGAREKGKIRIEGKEYIVQDGDVIYFRI